VLALAAGEHKGHGAAWQYQPPLWWKLNEHYTVCRSIFKVSNECSLPWMGLGRSRLRLADVDLGQNIKPLQGCPALIHKTLR